MSMNWTAIGGAARGHRPHPINCALPPAAAGVPTAEARELFRVSVIYVRGRREYSPGAGPA